MKKFSTNWASSKSRRKQRKYRFNAPLHIKQRLVSANLSKDLRKKYGRRSIGIRSGDRVRIMRGQFKKKTGKVERIDLKDSKVFVTGIDTIKKDGSKSLFALPPSNLQIIELELEDKKRKKKFEKSSKNELIKKQIEKPKLENGKKPSKKP